MALAIATVADSIAGLSVSGVTLYDVDNIPSGGFIDPVIIPLPDFVSGFSMTRDSFGGASAKMTVNYTLNYRLLYKKAGAGVGSIIEYFDDMIDKAALFLDAVLAIDTLSGFVDFGISNGITNMGLVNSPDELMYHGCDLHIDCMEFVN